jgi:hypothetical protein
LPNKDIVKTVAIYPVIKEGKINGWKRVTTINSIAELEQWLAKIQSESGSAETPTATALSLEYKTLNPPPE